jgi:hypothetical protein
MEVQSSNREDRNGRTKMRDWKDSSAANQFTSNSCGGASGRLAQSEPSSAFRKRIKARGHEMTSADEDIESIRAR